MAIEPNPANWAAIKADGQDSIPKREPTFSGIITAERPLTMEKIAVMIKRVFNFMGLL